MRTVSLILIFMKRVVQMGFMMTLSERVEASSHLKPVNLHIFPATSQLSSAQAPGPGLPCP